METAKGTLGYVGGKPGGAASFMEAKGGRFKH